MYAVTHTATKNILKQFECEGLDEYNSTNMYGICHHKQQIGRLCAVSLHEGAKLTLTRNISSYFEPSDDKGHLCPIVIHSRLTESTQLFDSLHTFSTYKQITSRTISGPVCQPGSGRCHPRSDGCCVILWPYYLLACLLLMGSCGTTPLFTPAKFILPGQKYENDLSPVGLRRLTLTSHR